MPQLKIAIAGPAEARKRLVGVFSRYARDSTMEDITPDMIAQNHMIIIAAISNDPKDLLVQIKAVEQIPKDRTIALLFYGASLAIWRCAVELSDVIPDLLNKRVNFVFAPENSSDAELLAYMPIGIKEFLAKADGLNFMKDRLEFLKELNPLAIQCCLYMNLTGSCSANLTNANNDNIAYNCRERVVTSAPVKFFEDSEVPIISLANPSCLIPLEKKFEGISKLDVYTAACAIASKKRVDEKLEAFNAGCKHAIDEMFAGASKHIEMLKMQRRLCLALKAFGFACNTEDNIRRLFNNLITKVEIPKDCSAFAVHADGTLETVCDAGGIYFDDFNPYYASRIKEVIKEINDSYVFVGKGKRTLAVPRLSPLYYNLFHKLSTSYLVDRVFSADQRVKIKNEFIKEIYVVTIDSDEDAPVVSNPTKLSNRIWTDYWRALINCGGVTEVDDSIPARQLPAILDRFDYIDLDGIDLPISQLDDEVIAA